MMRKVIHMEVWEEDFSGLGFQGRDIYVFLKPSLHSILKVPIIIFSLMEGGEEVKRMLDNAYQLGKLYKQGILFDLLKSLGFEEAVIFQRVRSFDFSEDGKDVIEKIEGEEFVVDLKDWKGRYKIDFKKEDKDCIRVIIY